MNRFKAVSRAWPENSGCINHSVNIGQAFLPIRRTILREIAGDRLCGGEKPLKPAPIPPARYNLVAGAYQLCRDPSADEPACPRNQDAHR
jgi:hypothetical protein